MEMRRDGAHRPSVTTVTGRCLPLRECVGARADGVHPRLPKLQSNLPRMSRSRVTLISCRRDQGKPGNRVSRHRLKGTSFSPFLKRGAPGGRMRSLGSSDGGVLPAGSPDCWEGIAYGPASAHLRTPRLQSHSFVSYNHNVPL